MPTTQGAQSTAATPVAPAATASTRPLPRHSPTRTEPAMTPSAQTRTATATAGAKTTATASTTPSVSIWPGRVERQPTASSGAA